MWSWKLAEQAQNSADELAQGRSINEQSTSTGEGERVTRVINFNIRYPLNEATRLWQLGQSQGHGRGGLKEDRYEKYGSYNPQVRTLVALVDDHFTDRSQIVCVDTTHIGMASTTRHRVTYVVARYASKSRQFGEAPFKKQFIGSLDFGSSTTLADGKGSKRLENTIESPPETGECSDSEVARWFL